MALTVVPQDFDGLLVLILPVIAVPTLIFVAAALEPLLSMGSDARRSFRNRRQFEETRARQVTSTLLRIGTPSLLAALLGSAGRFSATSRGCHSLSHALNP